MVTTNQRIYPDIFWVELHYHPDIWANGGPPDTYLFQVIGGPWGVSRWTVHAIWANRPAPDGVKAAMPRRSMGQCKHCGELREFAMSLPDHLQGMPATKIYQREQPDSGQPVSRDPLTSP